MRPADINNNVLQRRTKRGAGTSIPLTPRLAALAKAGAAIASPGQTIAQALGSKQKTTETRYIALRKYIQRAQEATGCTGRWRMHDLRRSAAHDLYSRTKDLRKVQALLCHSALDHSAWYLDSLSAELSADDLRPNTPPHPEKETKQ